jgi:hypothetical protein
MLWGQDIKVYRDHNNLTRDALGITSDRVYLWQLLLEEYVKVRSSRRVDWVLEYTKSKIQMLGISL